MFAVRYREYAARSRISADTPANIPRAAGGSIRDPPARQFLFPLRALETEEEKM